METANDPVLNKAGIRRLIEEANDAKGLLGTVMSYEKGETQPLSEEDRWLSKTMKAWIAAIRQGITAVRTRSSLSRSELDAVAARAIAEVTKGDTVFAEQIQKAYENSVRKTFDGIAADPALTSPGQGRGRG